MMSAFGGAEGMEGLMVPDDGEDDEDVEGNTCLLYTSSIQV